MSPSTTPPHPFSRRLRTIVVVLAMIASSAGCAAEEPDLDVGASTPISLSIHGLTSTCGSAGNKNPFSEIKSFDVRVRADDISDWKPSSKVPRSGKIVTIADVPAGDGREITLIGMNNAGKKLWYARDSGVKIKKNETTSLEMALMALDDFTCLGLDAGGASSVIFPAVTEISWAHRAWCSGGRMSQAISVVPCVLRTGSSPSNTIEPSAMKSFRLS